MSAEHPKEPNLVPDALKSLRVEIDAIDHQIIALLEQRNEVVEKVAAVKRVTGFGIRDFTRERELLANRGEHAETAGLRKEVIESLFRVILWASRDRQAVLNAEIPVEVEKKTIAIIGGHGGMGSLMASMFKGFGHHVVVSDLDTEITNIEAASQSDVIVVSVPIENTMHVIEEIGPHCKEDALLMDVTSTKTNQVDAMCTHSTCSVIGTHPLFGPSVHSLQGQRIALVCGRDHSDWYQWLKSMLHARGLLMLDTTAKEHDEAMSIVQVLTHQTTEVLGRTIQQLDVDIEQTLQFTSPIYLLDMLMAARHFAQSSELYASIQMNNPATKRVLDSLQSAGEELREVVISKDRARFNEIFEEVHNHFGDFSEQALEQSSFLIDRLVERG